MKMFAEAVSESFSDADGCLSFRFGPDNEYELTLEPRLFGPMVIGLYRNGELLLEDKVPVWPAYGGRGS